MATNYIQNARLNWVKGTAYPSSPANLYVALFTAAPSNSGGGTEVTGGTYARVAIASSGWSALSGNTPASISNSGVVDFGTTLPACTVVAFGIYDASSAGNLVAWANLSANKTVNVGDQTSFAAGALVLQES